MLSLVNWEWVMVFHLFNCLARACRIAARKYVIAALASFSFLMSPFSHATEPWADPKLPVRNGLELWLDASHAAGDQSLPTDGKLNQWRDASGKNRHLDSPRPQVPSRRCSRLAMPRSFASTASTTILCGSGREARFLYDRDRRGGPPEHGCFRSFMGSTWQTSVTTQVD